MADASAQKRVVLVAVDDSDVSVSLAFLFPQALKTSVLRYSHNTSSHLSAVRDLAVDENLRSLQSSEKALDWAVDNIYRKDDEIHLLHIIPVPMPQGACLTLGGKKKKAVPPAALHS